MNKIRNTVYIHICNGLVEALTMGFNNMISGPKRLKASLQRAQIIDILWVNPSEKSKNSEHLAFQLKIIMVHCTIGLKEGLETS